MIPQRGIRRGPDNSDDAAGGSSASAAPAKADHPFDFGVIPSTRYGCTSRFDRPSRLLQVVLINMLLVVAGWFLISPDAVTAAKCLAGVPPRGAGQLGVLGRPFDQPLRLPSRAGAGGDVRPDARAKLRNLIMSRDLTLWLLVAPATAILGFVLSNVGTTSSPR